MPNEAIINVALATGNIVVSAVVGKRIRMTSYSLVAAGAVTAQWKSGTTLKSGAMSLITGVPLAMPMGQIDQGWERGYITTAIGEDLVLTLGGAVQVSGHLTYEIVA